MAISQTSIEQYLQEAFAVDPEDLADDALLFSTGLLDSFHLVKLIAHVEQQVGLKVRPAEVSLDHFDSVGRILRFVERRTAHAH